MTKTVKVSLTIPEDILQAVKERSPDTTFSTAVSNLLRVALNGECVETTYPTLEDNSILQRIEALEEQQKEMMATFQGAVGKFRITPKVIAPAGISVKPMPRLHRGFIEITDEMRTEMIARFDSMIALGFTRKQIGMIMGKPNDSYVSKLINGQQSMQKQSYDQLMAWTPESV